LSTTNSYLNRKQIGHRFGDFWMPLIFDYFAKNWTKTDLRNLNNEWTIQEKNELYDELKRRAEVLS